MKKTDDLFVGDLVETKKSFKPMSIDGDILTLDKQYTGVVIEKRGGVLMIDIGEELPFTHRFGDLLEKPTGVAVAFKDVNIKDTIKFDDETEKKFVMILTESAAKDIYTIPRLIREKELKNNQLESEVKERIRGIEGLETTIGDTYIEIERMRKNLKTSIPDKTLLSKQYKKLIKNPKIKSVSVIKGLNGTDCFLVTTENLTYKNSSTGVTFDTGAFKILLPINNEEQINIVNYKKHFNKFSRHHVCIASSIPCLGPSVSVTLGKLREQGDLISSIYTIINFLEEPDYETPHVGEHDFSFAQDVTINPDNELDWFSSSYWDDNETWDGEKFTRESSQD